MSNLSKGYYNQHWVIETHGLLASDCDQFTTRPCWIVHTIVNRAKVGAIRSTSCPKSCGYSFAKTSGRVAQLNVTTFKTEEVIL
jgi:hypothetical protein